MRTVTTSRLRALVAAGLVVFVGGMARDIAWHATHNTQKEFETASKQVEVHWLLWLVALTLLIAGLLALRESPAARRFERAVRLTVASGVVYAVVSVWHFIEHANGADPQIAHVFLY